MKREFYPTAHIATVESYPYGRKRTRAYFGTEFHPKKGYRTTFQTVNPDTGRINAVKRSTYSDLFVMYRDETSGHMKHTGTDIISVTDEERNKAALFCTSLFDLFTLPELEYLYRCFITSLRVSMTASAMYGGADPEALKPLYREAVENAVKGLKAVSEGERVNLFNSLIVDAAAIQACKPKNFNPYRVKEVYVIDALGHHPANEAERAEAGV